MKYILLIALLVKIGVAQAQELFVFTEPASNMAAKSIGLRLNNYWAKDATARQTNYHLIPEIMVGVSKKIMLHADAFLSNRNKSFVAEGGSLYAKYRFFSVDDVHSHLRLSAYGRYSFNTSDVHQPAIDLYGYNSGYQGGVIATQLIHKVAISMSTSFVHALDNGREKFSYADKNRNAVNYTLSLGKLMLPKEYVSYKQINVNLMAELLGQTNVATGNNYLDLAPSAQFIFGSRARVDIAYRFALVDKLVRTTPNFAFLRLEYNLFNAF